MRTFKCIVTKGDTANDPKVAEAEGEEIVVSNHKLIIHFDQADAQFKLTDPSTGIAVCSSNLSKVDLVRKMTNLYSQYNDVVECALEEAKLWLELHEINLPLNA